MAGKRFKTVDEYLAAQPASIKNNLKLLRESIRSAAPHAEKVIRYNIPTYRQGGTLVYFAVRKEHIGFYPFRSAINQFRNEIKDFEFSMSTVKFPGDNKIPVPIIKKMVKFRLNKNLEKASLKKSKPKKRGTV